MMLTVEELALLQPFATPRQQEVLAALLKHKGARPAARALKIHHTAVLKVLRAVRKRAALQGVAPAHDMHHAVPEPFIVRGTSTLYKDGAPLLQWVKTRVDGDKLSEAMREAVEALAEPMPRAKPITAPSKTLEHLCNLYTLTDCHVGMRAWAPETGANWDLDIAERTLIDAVCALLDAAPAADTAIVCNLGDFLHFDGLMPVTPSHGHVLDGDGRYSKVVRVAVRILRAIIDLALTRHRRVIVVMAEGNHDLASAVWLRHLFALLYENEAPDHGDDLPRRTRRGRAGDGDAGNAGGRLMLNVPQYVAGLVHGFWRGWYHQYAKACGPAQIELMKARSAWAKLMGLR